MGATPKLSVIMTVYNGAEFLQETLDAVFAQTFSDFEMVVVNNGCTDGTQEILDAVGDDRLHVIQALRHGTFGDGIRLAYENAKGEFVAVQDGDDVPLPDRFAKQVKALESDETLGLVSSAFANIDQDGNALGDSHPPTGQQALVDAYQTSNPLAHSTYMYRKCASDAVGGYPVVYAYGPDFALAVRLLKKGWSIRVLEDVLMKVREHVGQASMAPALGETRAHDALYLYMEASGLDGVSGTAKRAGGRTIVKWKLQYAVALMQSGHWRRGMSHLILGILRKPFYSVAYLGYQFGRKIGLCAPVKS